MMNNPKYITVAVVAVLFLFTGITFGQWPDDLQQAAVVTAEATQCPRQLPLRLSPILAEDFRRLSLVLLKKKNAQHN